MWSAADCFYESVSVAIGRYYYADVAACSGHRWRSRTLPRSSEHKHHRITCPWHTKALWRLLVGRTTVSYDAYESSRRPRRAGATHGAKMPALGEVVGA